MPLTVDVLLNNINRGRDDKEEDDDDWPLTTIRCRCMSVWEEGTWHEYSPSSCNVTGSSLRVYATTSSSSSSSSSASWRRSPAVTVTDRSGIKTRSLTDNTTLPLFQNTWWSSPDTNHRRPHTYIQWRSRHFWSVRQGDLVLAYKIQALYDTVNNSIFRNFRVRMLAKQVLFYGGVCPCVCLCVCMSAQNLHLYRHGISLS